jgi:hypothetical protein
LAAYSAKRRQASAISSIIKRSGAESIVRASLTHFAAQCRYALHLSTGYVPDSGMVANFPELLGRLANAIQWLSTANTRCHDA